VGGADHRPFGTYFFDAPQQQLAEFSRLFDLSETPVPPLGSSATDLFVHQGGPNGWYTEGREIAMRARIIFWRSKSADGRPGFVHLLGPDGSTINAVPI